MRFSIVLLALVGCVSVRPFQGPTGHPMFQIECSGVFLDPVDCLQKASELCGRYTPTSPNAWFSMAGEPVGFAPFGVGVHHRERLMFIECATQVGAGPVVGPTNQQRALEENARELEEARRRLEAAPK